MIWKVINNWNASNTAEFTNLSTFDTSIILRWLVWTPSLYLPCPFPFLFLPPLFVAFNTSALGVSSLVFSEDYGPVSPVDSQSSSSNKGYQIENSSKSGQSDRFDSNQNRHPLVQQQQQQQQDARRRETSTVREVVQDDEESAIKRENDRLKLAIREVSSAQTFRIDFWVLFMAK